MPQFNNSDLSISVVLYNTPDTLLGRLLASIDAEGLSPQLVFIDNSPAPAKPQCLNGRTGVLYHIPGENLGYGRGHNLAVKLLGPRERSFHLVVNPDVCWSGPVLRTLIEFLLAHNDVAHVMPKVTYPDGSMQYLCKLLPTPFDLFVRRFLPDSAFKRRQQELYELRASGYDKIMNIPYLSGCFMLFRREQFDSVGGFDERFFMYPEDIDITRRLHSCWKTMFFPDVTVVHSHEKASYKSVRMSLVHMYNVYKYFMKWGWFFDSGRKMINRRVIASLGI